MSLWIAFILSAFLASLSISPSFPLVYFQCVCLSQPIIIFLLFFHPPLLLHASYSSQTAPRVSRIETSQAVVPAEQLPCKAIQIEMFAENNMCVITA